MAQQQVVIVGASHAGFQLAASLRQAGFDGPVVLIGDEPVLPYQRPPLSKDYLDGKIGLDLLLMRPEAFYRDHRIEFLAGTRVEAIDRAAQGRAAGWRRAARLRPSRARDRRAQPGAAAARHRARRRVLSARRWPRPTRCAQRLAAAEQVVVIGAGFIGLEFAAVARANGKPVHIVELTDRVMGRVVAGADLAFLRRGASRHRRRVPVSARRRCGSPAEPDPAGSIMSNWRAASGSAPISCWSASGSCRTASWPRTAGLAVGNGIVVDEQLLTADPAISAIGDCASFPCRHARARRPASKRCRTPPTMRAASPTGSSASRTPTTALPWFWSEQGTLRLQIAGLTTGHDRTVLRGDLESGAFSVFCYRDGALLGIELINRPADHAHARRLLAAGREVTPEQAADDSFDLRAAATARAA